jgi:hypothetical protein
MARIDLLGDQWEMTLAGDQLAHVEAILLASGGAANAPAQMVVNRV